MADNKVVIELVAKDEASKSFVISAKNISESLKGIENSSKGIESAADAMAGLQRQMLGAVGVSLSLAGAFTAAKTALSAWFDLISGGIKTIDDYKMKVIGTAAAMVDMADKQKFPNVEKNYQQFKEYTEWLWKQSQIVDERVASSAMDVFSITTELAKKGVKAVSQEDVEIAGRLADKIKSVAPVLGDSTTSGSRSSRATAANSSFKPPDSHLICR